MDWSELTERFTRKQAKIGVIGLGYVGLPLLIEFCRAEYEVLGFDVDDKKTEALNRGESYIHHITSDRLAEVLAGGQFEATTDFGRVVEADALIICVPTPLTKHREPDLSYIRATGETIAANLRAGQLIVLESTTYPGTTDEILREILETSGLCCGKDFLLAFSPEREDPGNPMHSTAKVPKVVGGCDAVALAAASALYSQIVVSVVPVSSARTAEAVKLTENIFRSVNIALVNELKMVYSKMGIDIWEVIEAAKTKPFGFMPFYPGPGLGGHCIPIDPFYLTWKAREFGVPTRFIELAGEVNTAMPQYVVTRLADALNDRVKSINGSRILILGVAYKKDVDDTRESPANRLISMLQAKGAKVDYYDPYVPVIPAIREFPQLEGMRSIEWKPETIAEYDAILIATAHGNVDYQSLVDSARLIIDTRNATAGLKGIDDKVVKA